MFVLKKPLKLLPFVTLTALALAGCGAPTTPAAPGSPSSHAQSSGHEGHDHEGSGEATETAERSPRIVVATDTGVTVLDQELAALASFETTDRPTLTTLHDDRHVAAVQGQAGEVHLVDAGSWTQGHGDHFHSYVADPTLLDEALTGGKPVHVVGNAAAEQTAIYFDEQGSAQLIDAAALESGELHGLATVASTEPHHGVVLPLANGTSLVTQKGTEALPDSIDLVAADGKAAQSFTCTGMHGDVVVGNTAAFGCIDSVLIVRNGTETRVANPADDGERVGALVSDRAGKVFVGDWASDSLVFIVDDKATVTPVGVEYSNIAATPDGRFAVIGTDGTLRIYDSSGAEAERFEALTEPWTKPQGHGALTPSLAAGDLAGANMIWVSEPGAGKVHAVDLFAGEVTSVEVAGQPGSIAVTNAS